MNEFMKRAIDIALQNVAEGGQPFSAVLVKDGEIIAEGVNDMHLHYDVTGHSEINAIKKAQEKLQTLDLSGTSLYCSGHPCPMCLTAIYFSGITDVYYCNSVEDAASVGMTMAGHIYDELSKPNQEREIVTQHIPLDEGMEDPMKVWEKR